MIEENKCEIKEKNIFLQNILQSTPRNSYD